MLKYVFFLAFSLLSLASCTTEGEICDCWKELVTREGDKQVSEGCAYILEMSHEEITAEAGPECVEQINQMLFNDDAIEFEEDLDEDAMMEQGDY